MSTLATALSAASSDELAFYRAFTALAADPLLTDAAHTARILARGIVSARDMWEFGAVSRFHRATAPGSHMAPLYGYLDGLHFYRVHRCDDLHRIDWSDLQAGAWLYLDSIEDV